MIRVRTKFYAGLAALAGIAAVAAAPAQAQDYPTREMRSVVGFPAGSGADIYARHFANKLAVVSKGTMIVENKPGANSSIATETVARSRPDGYTMFIGGSDAIASPLYLMKKPPIDPRKDFIYVSPLVSQGFILMVAETNPAKNVAELTAAMRAKGDKASYPTTNNPAIILGETYKNAFGLKTLQVPYRTSVEFINDMVEGRLDWVMADPVFAIARMGEKKMKPLAISTGKRISTLPNIPTMQEAGIPGVDMNLWWITAVPAGTPRPIVEKLNAWWTEIGKSEDTKAFLARFGAEPWTATLAETQAAVDKEIRDWEGYVKTAKIEPQ